MLTFLAPTFYPTIYAKDVFPFVFDVMVFLCYRLSANESSEPPMMIPGSTTNKRR